MELHKGQRCFSNLRFTLSNVEQETEKHIKDTTGQDIANYVKHAQEEDRKFRNLSTIVHRDPFK